MLMKTSLDTGLNFLFYFLILKVSEKIPNLSEEESKISNFWKEIKLFKILKKNSENQKPFKFYQIPTNPSCPPDLSQLLENTILDIFSLFSYQTNKSVEGNFFWNCHSYTMEYQTRDYFEKNKLIQSDNEIPLKSFNFETKLKLKQIKNYSENIIQRIAGTTNFENSHQLMNLDYMER